MIISGSWSAIYNDGTSLSQFDSESPHYLPDAGEVPYRAIEWDKVQALVLASQFNETRLDINPAPEGFNHTLRSRHFRTMQGDQVMCFIVMTSRADQEVDKNSVVSAYYWFPDGNTHDCVHFDCPDVGNYGAHWVNGADLSLMPSTHALKTQVDAGAE